MSDFGVPLSIPNVTRTLLAAGFHISNFNRYPGYVEFDCQRQDRFGAVVRYRFVVADSDDPRERATDDSDGTTVVLVARTSGATHLSWTEFSAALGGAVPSWRALADEYADALRTASTNRPPTGWAAEGWVAFEIAVADGLSYLFGRSVRRFGSASRGQAVPDFLALTPDDRLLVGDAKATDTGRYLLERPNLRPLVEYVAKQRVRQVGDLAPGGALIVAGDFGNDPEDARRICDEFMAEHQLPLALLPVEALVHMVGTLRESPHLRQRIRWRHILCVPGRVELSTFDREVRSATSEAWVRET